MHLQKLSTRVSRSRIFLIFNRFSVCQENGTIFHYYFIVFFFFFRHIAEHINIQEEYNTTYGQHTMQAKQRTDKAELAGRIGKRNKYRDI